MPPATCNRRALLLSLSASILTTDCFGQADSSALTDETLTDEIDRALKAFLRAFDDLDWPAFRACFAPGVTMFHPAPPNIKRIESPEAFQQAWLGVFERIKKQSGRTAPPYMNLQPQDLRIEMLSPEVALASFHLIDGSILCRRSILLKQYAGAWKIVHLHASNLAVTPS